ncbi:response regulator receiver protein [[Luteovulum] sphaeroides subsp. megalophilum]|uniref:response regulator n=1 Tax=Cereibacter sphaeroides TaxID=1063 RepID=UPI000B73B76D|nr:response regulator [Cereibacter sphaeroides]SNS67978.1 response regulator receiver protein [[Luteovulum] sphaeroides subsp. megalophilum]
MQNVALSLRILLVEDDHIQAQDLARDLGRMGHRVIGPFADIHEAIHRLDEVDAAVLDIRLGSEQSYELADCLLNRSVPFVFCTAADRTSVPDRFHRVLFFAKPCGARAMLRQLARQIELAERTASADLDRLVRDLRLHARELMPDGPSADRLVESALRALIETPGRMPERDEELRQRLVDLLQEGSRSRRGRHLN